MKLNSRFTYLAVGVLTLALGSAPYLTSSASAATSAPVAPAAAGAGASAYSTASVGWRDASNGISKVTAAIYSAKGCTGKVLHTAGTGYLNVANTHHSAVQVPGTYVANKRYWARITSVTNAGGTNRAGAACVQFVTATVGKWQHLTTPTTEPTTGTVTFNWGASSWGAGDDVYYYSITSSNGSCDGSGTTTKTFVHCDATSDTSYTFSVYAVDSYYLATGNNTYGDKTATISQSYTSPATVSGGTTTTTAPTTTTTAPTTTTTGVGAEGYYCAPGDVLNGTTCTHTATAPATSTPGYTCPSGWTLSGSNCTDVITTTEASCKNNSDTWLGGSSDNCRKTIAATEATTYTCPKGATLTGSGSTSTCLTTSTYPATYGPLPSSQLRQ